ncbi:hypothetical protein [Labedaea rhizosphaerae]|uniref:ABC-2 type transport system permease protein n=1 Tax=Labedaea rhizosphaerae TaxID=598644 RepID=A0A4R6S552_LABRH|nr:hypothetical protein [Labedaea rhizosphaerae]TDP94830.1 hypothetical protein EV186_10562 [Labedaea rhizosphaerae]
MTAFRAAFGYELRMQLRKVSVWVTIGALALLTAVATNVIHLVLAIDDGEEAAVRAARLTMALLPVGFGCLVADRLVRDDRLGVRSLLDATPGGLGVRLVGKFLGSCAATAIPVVGSYLLLVGAYAIRHGDATALGASGLLVVTVMLPALLFVGAFAMLCPLVMPTPLFRVLFVGYWFWSTLVYPSLLPTLNGTLFTPVNGYLMRALLHAEDGDLAGRVDGAALNFLRPDPSAVTAWLALGVLAAATALALSGARALLARTAR